MAFIYKAATDLLSLSFIIFSFSVQLGFMELDFQHMVSLNF